MSEKLKLGSYKITVKGPYRTTAKGSNFQNIKKSEVKVHDKTKCPNCERCITDLRNENKRLRKELQVLDKLAWYDGRYARKEKAGNGLIRCLWCGDQIGFHKKGCPSTILSFTNDVIDFLVNKIENPNN
ncbi:MAG: hypothetical protein ACOC2E_07255 [Bacteroidota bacterium]